ncbi:MAG: hypothetical protein UY64_C0031G0018 [Parcubacteria group bacterium GW2011_GWA1_51_12]|nr:MAG: hypothetical protein UY64_C0031G0018 [Parcubacteria group bacterium GW2011_GWA1_51_12]
MLEIVFIVIIYFFSIVIHEVAHGAAAYMLGDPTAKNAGRLTLNPLPHIDPFGTVLLPLVMALPAFFSARNASTSIGASSTLIRLILAPFSPCRLIRCFSKISAAGHFWFQLLAFPPIFHWRLFFRYFFAFSIRYCRVIYRR